MEEGSAPRGEFSAGSIGSISYLCRTQITQMTWKTFYNSFLQKGKGNRILKFKPACQLQPILARQKSPEDHATGSVTSQGKDPFG